MVRTVSIGWSAVLLVLMLASSPTLDHFLNSPDMGYQLSLGRLVLLGQFPFVDMVQHYGPLVALTSAAGQWVHDSVVPEVVICSLGYCLAMTCVFQVVMRGAAARPGWAMWVGLAASLAGWCVLARFYKWYYWCFPMLMLAGLSRVCEDRPRRRRWRLAVGLIAGVGFLYRHDLGGACLLAAIVVIAAQMAARTLGVRDRNTECPACARAAAPSGNRTGLAGGRIPAPGGLLVCRSGSEGWVDQLLVLPFRHVGRHIGHGRALASPPTVLGLAPPRFERVVPLPSVAGHGRVLRGGNPVRSTARCCAIAGAGRPTRFRCWPRESWG